MNTCRAVLSSRRLIVTVAAVLVGGTLSIALPPVAEASLPLTADYSIGLSVTDGQQIDGELRIDTIDAAGHFQGHFQWFASSGNPTDPIPASGTLAQPMPGYYPLTFGYTYLLWHGSFQGALRPTGRGWVFVAGTYTSSYWTLVSGHPKLVSQGPLPFCGTGAPIIR